MSSCNAAYWTVEPAVHPKCGTECVDRTVPVHVDGYDNPAHSVQYCPHCGVFLAGAKMEEFDTEQKMTTWVENAILAARKKFATKP